MSSLARWIEENWPRLVVAPENLPRWTLHDEDAPRAAGVYFLWQGTALLYVGVSGDVLYRMSQHTWAGKFPFDKFSVIEVDCDPLPFDMCSRIIEKSYIEALQPTGNTLMNGRGHKPMVEAIQRAWVEIEPPTSAKSEPHSAAVAELLKLTDDQRMAAFTLFCTHCGCTDPRCQCWNDD